ncbi:diguanylate cyclase [Alcanivorax sp. S6407]|uniref:GGDEF domain-containing protein n=1 Tax=Alcanivorax sp. S6407 TaxID=2926424 RepID=UPI001FF3AAFF|nr:GGDEF domain-containing protein [Alcanivorax sp. S6407]MCK0152926.1 diguanylate cyclase [Alcanivorax sp. S6407]
MARTVEDLEQELVSLREQLREFEHQSRQLDMVIQATGVGIWDWHIQTGATVFNERWANIIGYTLEEISPVSIETWMHFAHPEDLKESDRLLKAYWAGESDYYIFESRMKHKDGHWVWVYDAGQTVEWDEEGAPLRMVGTHLDITQQKEMELQLAEANKELAEMSYVDSLTGIPNRRAFDCKFCELVSATRRANSSLSLLIIDIDFFKQFNDLYGHQQGDEALRKVAQKIESALPRQTDFAARYGGEEIVVLLPYTPEDGAIAVAGKIISAVADLQIPHAFSDSRGCLSVSIGIANATSDFEDLFQLADQALYDAKHAGRNGFSVYSQG